MRLIAGGFSTTSTTTVVYHAGSAANDYSPQQGSPHAYNAAIRLATLPESIRCTRLFRTPCAARRAPCLRRSTLKWANRVIIDNDSRGLS